MTVRVVAVLLLAMVSAACVDRTPAQAPPSAPATVFALDLPGCGKPPSPDPDPPPEGAVMPPNSRITAVREQPPLVQLNGYVESTPRQVREWVESQPGLEVLVAEDEGYESEMLVTDGTWRTFIKARAVCDEGSLLAEVIAPQDSDAAIPAPAGSPVP